MAGLKCIIYIPDHYRPTRIPEMKQLNAEVHFNAGTYEDCVKFSSQQAMENSWYDANPGGSNTSLQIMAYAEVAYEIYDQLRDAPKIVAAPVSNGTLLAGIYRGFENLYKRGKTSRIPRMVAASSKGMNPIIQSFHQGLDQCLDLPPASVTESSINEPLINWHSFDGDEALSAVKQSNGTAFHISDTKMVKMAKLLKDTEGLSVLPASTAGLAALLEMARKMELEPDRYVAVLTSRG